MNEAPNLSPAAPTADAQHELKTINVSRVESARDTATSDCTVTEIIDQIRTGRGGVRTTAERLRAMSRSCGAMPQTNDEEKAAKKAAKEAVDNLKKTLPAVTWSGTFARRKDDALIEHSGLLCVDLDHLGEELAEVPAKLIESLFLYALFTSPSGDGLKAVFRVPANGEKHLESHRALREHVLQLTGKEIDESCKNVSRLCFLSYDPDVYLKEKAVEIPLLAEPEPPPQEHGEQFSAGDARLETRRRIANELLGDIDWYSETQGYITCPGEEGHGTRTEDTHCRVHLDGAPNIHCFHSSCAKLRAEVNRELRSRIADAERNGSVAEEAAVIAATYFVEDKYWKKTNGVWRASSKQNFADDLRVIGINSRPSSRNDSASDVLRIMSRIRAERVLDAAVPIVHDSREIIDLNSRQVLNISRIRAMQPAAADDPQKSAWLHEFFEKVWDPAEPQQRDYFLAWFQRYYQNALDGHPKSGQAIVVAGDAGIGKTFLSWRIVGAALGGFSDGARFLKGETSFNKEIAEVPLLAIDDSEIADEVAARNKFTSALKKFVADPQITYHPKGVDEITIPCKNRIIITCNQDAHSLGVLPRLDTSIQDKLMFFKFGVWRPSYDLPGGPEQYVATILPFWLRWLLDWQPPAYVLSDNPRFGVVPYKHPLLVQAVEEESTETALKQLIDIWFKDNGRTQPEWMSAKALRDKLSWNEANRTVLARELGGPRLGRTLSSLGKDYVLDKRDNRSTNAGEYLVTSPAICQK